MNFPRYSIIGIRPVKVVTNEAGEINVLAYQWDTGEFASDFTYLKAVVFAEDPDVEIVDEDAFNTHTEALRSELDAKLEQQMMAIDLF